MTVYMLKVFLSSIESIQAVSIYSSVQYNLSEVTLIIPEDLQGLAAGQYSLDVILLSGTSCGKGFAFKDSFFEPGVNEDEAAKKQLSVIQLWTMVCVLQLGQYKQLIECIINWHSSLHLGFSLFIG